METVESSSTAISSSVSKDDITIEWAGGHSQKKNVAMWSFVFKVHSQSEVFLAHVTSESLLMPLSQAAVRPLAKHMINLLFKDTTSAS
jgi:hypothetical protein